MRFSFFDVMEKGRYLRDALYVAGHEEVPFDQADLLVLDCDWEWAHPRPQIIAEAVQRGIPVALYPHGGLPTAFVYDGLTTPNPDVALRLEHGPASLDLVFYEDLHMEAHGWLYTPTAEFQPVSDPYRILFAPQHPNIEAMNTGHGPDTGPKFNQHVYRQLLDLGMDVTVSAVGPHWRNGIWAHQAARIIDNPGMGLTHAYQLVMEADVVVAAGTLAAVAVACGKPTVFVGGHDCSDYIDGQYRRARHADEYEDRLRYPLNAEDGPLMDLIRQACVGSDATRAWREAWIGDDGTAGAVRALGHLVGEQHGSRHSFIGGVTARSSGSA